MERGGGSRAIRTLLGLLGLLGGVAVAVQSLRGRLPEDMPPILGLFVAALLATAAGWILEAQRFLGHRAADLDWNAFWGGAFTIGVGCFLAAVSVADPRDEAFNAPRWVVTVAGGIFALFGAMAMRSALVGGEAEKKGDLVSGLLATLILTGFGVLCTFTAFGPGEREFEGGVSLGPFAFDFLSGEVPGRIAFGIAAVILDLFALFGWAVLLAAALAKHRARRREE